jgi:hypothetical protein
MKSYEQLKAENDAIRATLARGEESRLLAIPGVFHVSVGLKEKEGQFTEQLCVRVYVREKRSRAEVAGDEQIPREIEGVPTDVNVVPGQVSFQDNTRYRPIQGGIMVTNRIVGINAAGNGRQIPRGTLGCLAIDKSDNAPVMLSNWHVLYGNQAADGDPVFQPAPTTLPQLTALQLPFHPTDDTDKIGKLRRGVITNKVDGAIASVDVSSCCHCCGVRYTNDIAGLSSGGHPTGGNTIIGDVAATGGLAVYKRGQKTLRTEGRIVDPNYPPFPLTRAGTTYNFTGQIAIQNVTPANQFSDEGDSGSALITDDNKIVGLIFAVGHGVPVLGVTQPWVSFANHIGDVLTALNISIPYSPTVVVTSGQRLRDATPVLEAPVPEPYRLLRERLQRHETTSRLFSLGERHADEVTRLVNHCKPVTIAWHRSQGPALLATIMSAVRDGHYRLPASVKGIAPYDAVERMRGVLAQHGSPALREHLGHPETATALEELRGCAHIDEVIDRIAGNERLRTLLREVPT